MPMDAAFLASTRGRIVDLLRRESRTVDELAGELGITDNAVRLHLATLERDHIVRSAGARREGTVGKPAIVYEIDPAAEPSFSHAYLPLLTSLLGALGDRLSAAELRSLMRDVGHRLAGSPDGGTAAESETPHRRALAASRVLNELGSVTTVERAADGSFVVQGRGCPLSVAVAERPEVCRAVQAMLGDVVGGVVREQCDRDGRVQCRFEMQRSA